MSIRRFFLKKQVSDLEKKWRPLYKRDFQDNIESCRPGEWVIFVGEGEKNCWIGFLNPLVESGPIAWPIKKIAREQINLEADEEGLAKTIIREMLTRAIDLRKKFYPEGNCRLVFGDADNLPGCLADGYGNFILVQITTAGIDRFRKEVVEWIQQTTNKKTYLFDKEELRTKEGLPVYPTDPLLIDTITTTENGLKLELGWERVQKNGFYYDHRENRKKLAEKITQMDCIRDRGLDLFCYVGSWGIHALRAGIKEFWFVDAANLGTFVNRNLEINGFSGRGKFIRQDVFSFLSEIKEEKFDIIVTDPPAFMKDDSVKERALSGYRRLYENVLPKLNPGGLLVAASCSQGITFEDLDCTLATVAGNQVRKTQLLDIGIAGHDHPVMGLSSTNQYLKYLLYRVE